MRTIILGVLAVILAGVVVVLVWARSGPTAGQFAELANPRLTRLADRPMLVVEARGDPNVVGARAFKRLFSVYYRLDGVSRVRPPAPRARWPHAAETSKADWTGYYALPLPSGVSLPAEVVDDGDLPVSIRTWEYGTVAEVLHVGPYSTEEQDISRLMSFISSQGYRVVGDHEEEYVRGPGMFFADPETYLTIIRLRIAEGAVVP